MVMRQERERGRNVRGSVNLFPKKNFKLNNKTLSNIDYKSSLIV